MRDSMASEERLLITLRKYNILTNSRSRIIPFAQHATGRSFQSRKYNILTNSRSRIIPFAQHATGRSFQSRNMTKYKLIYFNIRVLGEPIRYILHYMGKEFEDYRMPREDWVNLKEKVPFGKLPLLEIDGKVFHQSTAILRYLAIEAGLAGNNACENFQIDMIVAAFGDFVAEVSRFFKMENPTDKEKLRLSIINNSVPFYMTRLENALKNNGGYLANGKLSWAELYIVGYCTSLPGLIGIDLTEKYPFFKQLTDRVHSLPGIKDWVKRRPITPM